MKGYEDLVKLLNRVQSTGGLDVDMESVCEYQDMIGHSSIEQLEALANGTCKESFYRVYGAAYGVIEAIRFHCQHGEKITEIIRKNDELNLDLEDLKEDIEKKDALIFAKDQHINELISDIDKKNAEIKKAAARAEKAEQENILLKAKLYDLMTA